jgi:hypothetical protein
MPEVATGFLPQHGEAGLQTLLSCGGLPKAKVCGTKNFDRHSWRARKVRKSAQGPKDRQRSFQPHQLDLNSAHRLGMHTRRLTLTSCPSHDLISMTT